ncbi:hypothetical protein [Arsenophonus nasoniae]|uniref:hypothetical protein n=1 Tax=Arsenophonus nasoniae TaxID=638 RepID=UPI00387A56B4
MWSINKNIVLFFISVLILTLSFQFNFFNAASKKNFYNFQRDSEGLVLGRLIETDKNGFMSQGGFLGRYISNDLMNYQHNAYKNNFYPQVNFGKYTSSAGFQGFFYASIDQVIKSLGVESGSKRFFLIKLLTSAGVAVIISLFIIFVLKEFGFIAAITTIFFASISQSLVVFSNNLYWMCFLLLFPFVFVCLFLQQNSKKNINFKWLYVVILLAILIKSLAGYEYISTVLISIMVPLIFYAIKDNWDLFIFIKRAILLSITSLIGFFSAIFLHLLQLTWNSGSFSKGFATIWYIIAKRTYGNPDTVQEIFRKSLESNVRDVLSFYWNGSAIDLQSLFGISSISVKFSFLIILIAVISIIGTVLASKFLHNYKKINLALVISLWFSILAPLSWFILAKGHSYIHVHINYILWYVPFLLIGFSYLGFFCQLVWCLLKASLNNKRFNIIK